MASRTPSLADNTVHRESGANIYSHLQIEANQRDQAESTYAQLQPESANVHPNVTSAPISDVYITTGPVTEADQGEYEYVQCRGAGGFVSAGAYITTGPGVIDGQNVYENIQSNKH